MKRVSLYSVMAIIAIATFMNSAKSEDTYQYVPGQLNPDHLIINKNKDIIHKKIRKGQTNFTLTYFKDTFDYKDSRGTFKRTYEDGFQSTRVGFIQMGFDDFVHKGWLDVTWGGNLGIGHSRGRGSFSSGDTSDALFQLWSIPLDFILGLEIPISSWAKLGAYAGPSAMALMQTRNDKDHSESKKTKNQVSYGYVTGARFKLGLANIFPDTMFELFSGYRISNLYFNIDLQIRNYTNFQDEDISIEGSSIGAGFSFEYL